MIDIDREHPDYAARKATWKQYRDLYAGGEQFKASASEYLVKRHREPLDVYYERLQRVFYENYLGSIVDWYGATLFRREPIVTFQGENETGRAFFNRFVEDCDLKGSCISDFFRRVLIEALVAGTAYILVDFPRWKGPAANRAEEEAGGQARAYLVECGAQDVINWQHDEMGNFDWIVLRTSLLRQSESANGAWTKETKWI